MPETGVNPEASDPHEDVAAALHDVSNALTIILGWVSEARAADADPQAVAHALQIIEDQARIARSLARSAIGAAPAAVDREESLDAVVGSAVAALSVEASLAGVDITTSTDGALAHVSRSADVRQVVTNLLLNALAFAPRGSRVTVAIDDSPVAAVVSVQDEGPGVPVELRGVIFSG
jgi:signal transduction histidine kinase